MKIKLTDWPIGKARVQALQDAAFLLFEFCETHGKIRST